MVDRSYLKSCAPRSIKAVPVWLADPYGIKATDSTTDIIEEHSKKIRTLINQTPPRPGCVMPVRAAPDQKRKLGAWFASPSKLSGWVGAWSGLQLVWGAGMTVCSPSGPRPPAMKQWAPH